MRNINISIRSLASLTLSVGCWIGGASKNISILQMRKHWPGDGNALVWGSLGKSLASLEVETRSLGSFGPKQRSTYVMIWVSTPASTRAPSTKRGTEVKPYLSQEWPSSKLTLGWKQVHERDS